MRRFFRLSTLLITILIILCGCGLENRNLIDATELDSGTAYQRPGYQKDKTLKIALNGSFSSSFNPFIANTQADRIILDIIFPSPLKPNADNELIPWYGNILHGINADGTTSFVVKVDTDLKFTDGTPITIDDYLYSLYVKADPSYTGDEPLLDLDIVGLKEYYYDSPDYEESIEGIRESAKTFYRSDSITQDDFVAYLVESRIEGTWDEKGKSFWVERLLEDGWEKELETIGEDNEAELLELVALSEYAYHQDEYDPTSWYEKKLTRNYISENLAGDKHVETISGIEKLGEHSCRITFNSTEPDSVRKLNTYIVPRHYYGKLEKGNVKPILENNIPLGSGPYTFYASYEDKVVLKANNKYHAGIPNIGLVEFKTSDENEIIKDLAVNEADIALFKPVKEKLRGLRFLDNLEYNLVAEGSYPSVFISADIPLKTRDKLSSIITYAKLSLDLTPIEKILRYPLSPVSPETPKGSMNLGLLLLPERTEESRHLTCLVEETIVNDMMKSLMKIVRERIIDVNGSIEYAVLPREEIEKRMKESKADMVIMNSEGTISEKSRMYKSDSEFNIQNVDDAIIDELLDKINASSSLDERRKLTGMLLDRIMLLKLEVPLFLENSIIAYNTNTLDMSSLPDVSTSTWNFLSSLWSLIKN